MVMMYDSHQLYWLSSGPRNIAFIYIELNSEQPYTTK